MFKLPPISRLRALSLSLLLAGCSPAPQLVASSQQSSQLTMNTRASAQKDVVKVQVQLPTSATNSFKTQAAQSSQAVYVRLTVKAVDLQRDYTNTGGITLNGVANLVAFNGASSVTLTVEDIPPGKNRLVIAQLYDADAKELTSLRAMGLFHSRNFLMPTTRFSDENPTTNVIEQTVSRRNVPVLSTLEQAINSKDTTFISQIENYLDAIAAEFDKILYGNNPVGSPFQTEPQRIDPGEVYTAMKSQLQSLTLSLPGGLPAFFTAQTPTIVDPASSVTVHVATPTGFNFTQDIKVVIDDPGSSPVTFACTGLTSPQSVTLTNVERGTRRLTVYNAAGTLVLGHTTVTVDPDTGISFAGNAGSAPGSPLFLLGNETGILISSLSQTSGAQNTAMTLNGVGYAPSPNHTDNTVKFGSSPATITGSSTGTANILVPDLIGGTYPVTITRLGVQSNFINFNVLPVITSLDVTQQRITQPVTLTGTGFHPTDPNANQVVFGSTAVPAVDITPVDGHHVTVKVPAGISGNQQIKITIGGQVSNLSNFDVRPYVQSVSPTAAIIGNTVDLSGTGFAPTAAGNTVTFTRTTAPFTSVTVPTVDISNVSNTTLRVKVPAGVSGAQNISVTVGTQTSNDTVPFNVIPTLASLSPTAQIITGSVTLTGTGFSPVASENSVNVGGTPVPTVDVTPISNTQLSVKVPAGVSAAQNVSLAVNGQNASNQPGLAVIPNITGVAVNNRSTGQNVVIQGTGFSTSPTVQIGGLNANVVGTPTNTSITATVPGSIVDYGTKTINVTVGSQAGSFNGFNQIMVSPCAMASTPGTTPQIGDPVSYFQCFDAGPVGTPGVDYNNITTAVDRLGVSGSGFHLDGSTSYQRLNVNISPSVRPLMTLNVWARHNTTGIGVYSLISQDDTPWDRSISLDSRIGTAPVTLATPGWGIWGGSGGVINSQVNAAGGWVMLTAVYNQPAGTATLYLNGNLIAFGSGLSIGDGTPSIMVGRNATFVGEYFNVDVDDLMVIDKAMTAADVMELYNRTKP